MAAALEDTPVSYDDLAAIELEFDDVETEIIKQQIILTTPLYTLRQKTLSQIPNFWPLVLEQAPPDIDQYIQPSDSALLLSSLTSLSVEHFEASTSTACDGEKGEGNGQGEVQEGDPRSVSITFEFSENEYFTDKRLEKKFWYRRARDGWSGFVSEPVPIAWKEGRDLTGGLLGLVVKAWEAEHGGAKDGKNGKEEKEGLSSEQKALKKMIENTGMGGLSFFAWFGFIGRRISAAESALAVKTERENRERRKRGEKIEVEEEDEEEDDDLDMSLEIFPDGDELAVAFTEDLWPGAIKYFTQAQEQDALSDADFEDSDAEGGEGDEQAHSGSEDDEEERERPSKKRRS